MLEKDLEEIVDLLAEAFTKLEKIEPEITQGISRDAETSIDAISNQLDMMQSRMHEITNRLDPEGQQEREDNTEYLAKAYLNRKKG